MHDFKKILVRSPNWIGDQILAYPFFHYLREAYPSAQITVVCVPWVESIQFRNLVDEVIILPKPAEPDFFTQMKVFEQISKDLRERGPWDLSICLPNSFSSAWLFFRAQSKRRRGYRSDGRGILLNEPLDWNPAVMSHRAEDFMHLLPKSIHPSKLRKPILEFWGLPPLNDLDEGIPGVLDFFDAEKAWPHAHPLDAPAENFWILAPGSTAESRRWPLERFASLAGAIARETGWKGVLIGGIAEKTLASRLVEDPTLHLIDRTGQGSVASYWKMFRKAKFSVCNDSGLAHVASLCGSPVQVVWGAGNPKKTEPIGPGKVRIFFNPVDCWPCESNSCQQPLDRKLECLKGIHSEDVWKEIKAGIRI